MDRTHPTPVGLLGGVVVNIEIFLLLNKESELSLARMWSLGYGRALS